MRILRTDRKQGLLELAIQSLEDMWHLHKVLEPGDLVRAKTYRKVAVKRGQEIVEGDKKPVLLTLRVERSEFHPYTGRLRLLGTIVSGPPDIQLASRHTIQVEPGMVLTLQKPSLPRYVLERLQKARVQEADIFFCALDRDEADFAELRAYGLQAKGSLPFRKRDQDDRREAWYDAISAALRDQPGRIVLCGPGFEAQNLFRFLRRQHPDLALRASVEHASTTDGPGIREVLAQSGDKLLKESRLARESGFVERLLREIRTRGKEAHGPAAVQRALQFGAVETLLVSDTRVRECEPLLEQAERTAAAVALVATDHPAGEQLLALGGIAALLRFRPPEQ
ncbi:MAG: mRNA surveillance protein pelota [Candidatus Aenigmarchaeota archaeon]|nr:mRNA surveillance protein pelota [Candidatus Aenigmarchaeota archaeon]